jgi:DNA-binding LytR/AlgR family response regulator
MKSSHPSIEKLRRTTSHVSPEINPVKTNDSGFGSNRTGRRVRKQSATHHSDTAAIDRLDQRPSRSPCLTRLTVNTGDKVVIIKTAEIDAIESAGNYVAVQAGKESFILRETLSALEAQLDTKKFLRISRSAIVNLDRVKELLPMFKGEHVMVLHSGKHLTMTRRLREVERALRFS